MSWLGFVRWHYPPKFGFQTRWVHSAYRPLAFYSLVRLSQARVTELKEEIHHALTERGVLGRIYLADGSGIGGINCQMSVPLTKLDSVQSYFKSLETDLGPIEYTQGMQDTEMPSFRKLKVLTKKNLVALNTDERLPDQSKPDYLTPQEWHQALDERGEKAFILDMRNHYEYTLGHFDHAIKMNVSTFRDGIQVLDSLVENQPKDREVYMYCTGGIRCSVIGPYLKQKGFEHVKMLKGGISAYGKYIKEHGKVSLFKGKNYVFDDRRTERITKDVLAQCYQCGSRCDHVTNCKNHLCHLLFVQCDSCRLSTEACSKHCQDVLEGKASYGYDYDYLQQTRGVS